MTKLRIPPAPDAITYLVCHVKCKCAKERCSTKRCQCRKAGDLTAPIYVVVQTVGNFVKICMTTMVMMTMVTMMMMVMMMTMKQGLEGVLRDP